MFGQNPIARPRSYSADETYHVQEVFYTLQGEGPFAGHPAVFVRLAGCNLRCHFCDTDFTSSDWHPSLDALIADIAEKRGMAELVVITGGEPLLQEIGPLCYEIVRTFGMTVQIETAGTVWPASFDDSMVQDMLDDQTITLVCSPKTGRVHEQVALHCQNWKYIVSADDGVDEIDGLPNTSTQVAGARQPVFRANMAEGNVIWVQPRDEYDLTFDLDTSTGKRALAQYTRNEARSKASMQLAASIALQHGYVLSLQTHKLVGLP